MKVLVTGAGGFVGRALVPFLASQGHEVVAASRGPLDHANSVQIADVSPETDWSLALENVEAVVHRQHDATAHEHGHQASDF